MYGGAARGNMAMKAGIKVDTRKARECGALREVRIVEEGFVRRFLGTWMEAWREGCQAKITDEGVGGRKRKADGEGGIGDAKRVFRINGGE